MKQLSLIEVLYRGWLKTENKHKTMSKGKYSYSSNIKTQRLTIDGEVHKVGLHKTTHESQQWRTHMIKREKE